MSRVIKLILVIIALFLGLAFHLKNNQLIELNYYLGSVELSISLLVVLVLCAGVFLGALASLPMIISLKRKQIQLKKQIEKTEKEINNLRVLPVRG